MIYMRGSLSIVQFLCSAGASRFSAPASFFEGVARRGGQDWPQATAAGGLVLTITSTPPCWAWWGVRCLNYCSGVDRLWCNIVRLAHQLISGSSVTACHNPACTNTDNRGDGFTLFAGAKNANRILDCPSPRPGPRGPEAQPIISRSRCTRPVARLWP